MKNKIKTHELHLDSGCGRGRLGHTLFYSPDVLICADLFSLRSQYINMNRSPGRLSWKKIVLYILFVITYLLKITDFVTFSQLTWPSTSHLSWQIDFTNLFCKASTSYKISILIETTRGTSLIGKTISPTFKVFAKTPRKLYLKVNLLKQDHTPLWCLNIPPSLVILLSLVTLNIFEHLNAAPSWSGTLHFCLLFLRTAADVLKQAPPAQTLLIVY